MTGEVDMPSPYSYYWGRNSGGTPWLSGTPPLQTQQNDSASVVRKLRGFGQSWIRGNQSGPFGYRGLPSYNYPTWPQQIMGGGSIYKPLESRTKPIVWDSSRIFNNSGPKINRIPPLEPEPAIMDYGTRGNGSTSETLHKLGGGGIFGYGPKGEPLYF